MYYESHKKGIENTILPTVVEVDGWLYNTTRNGVPT